MHTEQKDCDAATITQRNGPADLLTRRTKYSIDGSDFNIMKGFSAVLRKERPVTMCNPIRILGITLALSLFSSPLFAQSFHFPYPDYPGQGQVWDHESAQSSSRPGRSDQARARSRAYDDSSAQQGHQSRDGEDILRDQMRRSMELQQTVPAQPPMRQQRQEAQPRQEMYDDYYQHRISNDGQIRQVMAEARYIAGLLKKTDRKPFIVIDKRNFQFYLYDNHRRLLRIGPVAIGKGNTNVGKFETPIGIFPIRSKVEVADWIRPDWYFIEEGEPIPKRWEDRRVKNFFRYKLVFDGTRYIHYAEATGGRLTHGCLGLDWEDAEAVFHTLDKGSYCIIIDPPFIKRLAGGEFPIRIAAKPKKKKEATTDRTIGPVADNNEGKASKRRKSASLSPLKSDDNGVFGSMW
ncbi:L,D-transpeptidase [Thermodesulfobacteriota bacterium]